MTERLPRVIGLEDLLTLTKPLREKPAPLVYFSDAEFARLTKGTLELKRMPRAASPLVSFDPWPGGGMVQSRCTSPEGQLCVGQWTPAGPGHASGVFFGCRCRFVAGGSAPPPPPPNPCQLLVDAKGFKCTGTCEGGQGCRLGLYRDPGTLTVVLDCRCGRGRLIPR